MKTSLLAPSALLALAATASAQQIVMTQPALDVDLGAVFFSGAPPGVNPSCMAWDGQTLWVGGFNNLGTAGTTGVVRVDNALTVPSISSPFAVLATPAQRGYTGLAIRGNTLAAAFDPGANDPNGIAAYDATSFAQLWAFNARGGSGVAFDPDFLGAGGPLGTGTGWSTFGSGRRALNDTANGAVIWSLSNGMIVDGGFGTAWRDIDFDPATGDTYLRMNNALVKAARTGSNTCAPGVAIGGLTQVASLIGQNLTTMNTGFGSFIVLNDKQSSAGGQSFFSVVKVFDTNGNPVSVQWPGTFAPATGTAYYDFDYDAASNTLAVMDFSARRVYFFTPTSPQSGTPFCFGDGTATACPCGNSGTAGNGCASSVNPSGANLSATGAPSLSADNVVLAGVGMPNSSALYFQGTSQQNGGLGVAFGDGLRCAGGAVIRLGTKANTAGASQYPASGDQPVSVRGLVTAPGTRDYQIWYRNSATFCTAATYNLSNGYEITWGP